jgi:RNA polymerase sigma factor (sigma-70 family)
MGRRTNNTRLTDEQRALADEHYPYACKLAKTFCMSHRLNLVHFASMRSAACLGLCHAARKFNPSLGFKFKTFCTPWINGALKDEVKNQMGVRRVRGVPLDEYIDAGPVVKSSSSVELWHPAKRMKPLIEQEEDLMAIVNLAPSWRARKLLRFIYLDGLTQAEAADRIGLSQARVSQLLRQSACEMCRRLDSQ